MLALCPSEAIQSFITSAALVCPLATFSPTMEKSEGNAVKQSSPFGRVCPKRKGCSDARTSAVLFNEDTRVSGESPAFALSALTSDRTSFSIVSVFDNGVVVSTDFVVGGGIGSVGGIGVGTVGSGGVGSGVGGGVDGIVVSDVALGVVSVTTVVNSDVVGTVVVTAVVSEEGTVVSVVVSALDTAAVSVGSFSGITVVSVCVSTLAATAVILLVLDVGVSVACVDVSVLVSVFCSLIICATPKKKIANPRMMRIAATAVLCLCMNSVITLSSLLIDSLLCLNFCVVVRYR